MKMDAHKKYLDNLIFNLNKIGEDRKGVEWLSREPILFIENSLDQYPMCDLLIGFYDTTGLCVELKSSKYSRDKAIKQLESGNKVMTERFGYFFVRSKIAYYQGGKFTFEEVEV